MLFLLGVNMTLCSCKSMSIFYRELCRCEMTWDFLKMFEKREKKEKGMIYFSLFL